MGEREAVLAAALRTPDLHELVDFARVEGERGEGLAQQRTSLFVIRPSEYWDDAIAAEATPGRESRLLHRGGFDP